MLLPSSQDRAGFDRSHRSGLLIAGVECTQRLFRKCGLAGALDVDRCTEALPGYVQVLFGEITSTFCKKYLDAFGTEVFLSQTRYTFRIRMSDERRDAPLRDQEALEMQAKTRLEALAPLVSLQEAQAGLEELDHELSQAKKAELSYLFRATTSVPLKFMDRICLLGRHDPVAATVLVLLLRKRFTKEQVPLSDIQRTVLEFIQQEWFPSIKQILERKEEEILEMSDEDAVTDPDAQIPPFLRET